MDQGPEAVVPLVSRSAMFEVTIISPALILVIHQKTPVTWALSEAFPEMTKLVVRALGAGEVMATVGRVLSGTTVNGTRGACDRAISIGDDNGVGSRVGWRRRIDHQVARHRAGYIAAVAEVLAVLSPLIRQRFSARGCNLEADNRAVRLIEFAGWLNGNFGRYNRNQIGHRACGDALQCGNAHNDLIRTLVGQVNRSDRQIAGRGTGKSAAVAEVGAIQLPLITEAVVGGIRRHLFGPRL